MNKPLTCRFLSTTPLITAIILLAGCEPRTSQTEAVALPDETAKSSTQPDPVAGEVTPDLSTQPSESESSEPTTRNSSAYSWDLPAMRMSSDAFRQAALNGRTEDVKRGLESGINIESSNPNRKHTALHMAAFNGHTSTVVFLLDKGATIDCRDFEGKTPLIHACTGPYPQTVEALIKAGADINAKGEAEGFTPLMMAAGLNQPKIVEILIANGADKDAVDQDNDKAIDHARRAGLRDIVQMLE